MADKHIYKFVVVALLAILALLNNHGVSAQSISCESLSTNPSSLNFHVNKQIDDRIGSADPQTGLDIYTSRSATLGTSWVRNPNSWTQKGVPLDFTGVAGWNNHNYDSNVTQRGATLITPRHFITAEHFKIIPGSTIQFFKKNGEPVARKVVKEQYVRNLGTDINVGLLESDVDSSIAYYPLVSQSQMDKYFIKINSENVYNLPIVIFNQFGQALLRRTRNNDDSTYRHVSYKFFTTDNLKVSFGGNIIKYDSGQPGFLIVNNQPILLFTHLNPEYGPNLGVYISEINETIQSMGDSGGYRVTEYDLSGFTQQPSSCTPPANTFDIDERIIVQSQITLYESYTPGSNPIGIVSVGNLGTVGDGPYYSDGLTWWGVQYDTGEVGYSSETGLAKYAPDTTAPTVPSGLSITSALTNRVNLSWTASTDATGISGYRIYRCLGASCTPTTEVGTTVTTNYSDTTVIEDTSYRYSVAAYDADLNLSAKSSVVAITTPATVVALATFTLSVSKSGTGTGTVSGGTINCGTTCTATVNSGTSVTLTAVASDDSTFTGWTNSTCTGTGACTLLMSEAKTTNAVFNLKPLVGICGTATKNYSASETFPNGTYCTRGTATPTTPTNPTSQTSSTWSCSGLYSGSAVSCTATRSTQPINGICGATINSCSTGSFAEASDSSTQYLWSCGGSNGGNVSSCSSSKPIVVPPAPPDPIIVQNNNIVNTPTYTPAPTYTPTRSVTVSNNTKVSLLSEITRNLNVNDSSEDVRLLQKTLNDLGYVVAESGAGSKGNETTVFDENTRQALLAYQQDRSGSGIDVNGEVDSLTKILLNKDIDRLSEGTFGEDGDSQNIDSYEPKSIIELVIEKIVLGFMAVFKKLWFF